MFIYQSILCALRNAGCAVVHSNQILSLGYIYVYCICLQLNSIIQKNPTHYFISVGQVYGQKKKGKFKYPIIMH